MTSNSDRGGSMPVAIVGIGCRFPGGATDPAAFWRLLVEGRDAVGPIPADRIDVERFHDPRPATPGRMVGREGGFVGPVDAFDAAFFGLSPREAARMDPQQRLLLETAWEALEDAGIDVRSIAGSATGVFVGQWTSDFEARLFADPDRIDFHMTTGTGRYASSGRLSHALRLMGPSMTIDTACSSSLVSVHLGVRSLREGESTLAVAAGVNLILQPSISIAYSQSRMMAPDARCKFGDARGDGYVRSEGVGVVVLKPLARAIADGDRIYATILGTAVNNDGGGSGSLGRPSPAGQLELLRSAYRDAGVDPARVGYVEAHGTGTRAGDPVELSALGALLGERAPDAPRCRVGSVKTNIGHTESAAGVAGLIKAALVLHHGEIPASLHLHEPNPTVPWDTLPLEIVRERTAWPGGHDPRIAGVTAFGISGTNAHAVLREAPARDDAPATARLRPLATSAASADALRARARDLKALLATARGDDARVVRDVCHTATMRRTALDHRLVVLGADRAALVAGLDAFLADEPSPAVAAGRVAEGVRGRLAFVFSGQGGQHVAMGRALYAAEPAFRAALDAADAAIRAHAGWSIVERIHADEPGAGLDDIGVVQPALFAIQVALAALWRAYGVRPDAVVGHSMGEAAAACVAGTLSLDDAARVIVRRSELLRRIRGQGAMAVVELDASGAAAAIAGVEAELSIGASNSHRSTVLSGEPRALESVLARLEARSVFCRRVQVDVASHSPQTEPLLADLRAALAGLAPRAGDGPRMLSTVTGEAIDGAALDADYWARNLREPVRLSAVVGALLGEGIDAFVEIGPHPLLLPSIRQDADRAGTVVATHGSMRRDVDEPLAFHGALAALHVEGRGVQWREAFPDTPRPCPLPAYPWQRVRHWYEPAAGGAPSASGGLLGREVRSSTDVHTRLWPVELDDRALGWLRDHRVRGAAILPAAAFVTLALEAASERFGDADAGGDLEIDGLSIDAALALGGATVPKVQLAMTGGRDGAARWRVSSRDGADDAWRVHASGRVRTRTARPADALPAPAVPASGVDDAHYAAMSARGLDYGPAFRAVTGIAADGDALVAGLALPAGVDRGRFALHPVLLDGGLQLGVSAAATADPLGADGTTYVPVGAAAVRWPARRALGVAAHVRVRCRTDASVASDVPVLDLRWTDARGRTCLEIDGLRLARIAAERPRIDALLHAVAWRPVDAPDRRDAVPGRWLVLEDGGGVAGRVVAAMRARGASVEGIAAAEPGRWGDALRGGGARYDGVAWFGAMDAPEPDGGADAFARAREAACDRTVALVRALAGSVEPPALLVVTRGAQAVEAGESPSVAQASAWGVVRTVRNEHPALRASLVDLPSTPDEVAIEVLASLTSGRRPEQCAIRGRGLRVPALVPMRDATDPADRPPAQRPVAGDRAWRFATATPGVLDGLVARRVARSAPPPGHVEIAVEATGVNFMNVLSALGRYPGFPDGVGPLGIECAGTVVRCGPGVERVPPGARVLGYAPDCLASHVVVDARLVRAIPASMDAEAAASWPVVFMTAVHALLHCARLQRGERVLIHAGAGGVGLAALQVALDAGAEVYATAGSPEKRALLESLGVRHAMDSRSLAFRDELLALTGGDGVDVVLNSLAGEFVEASLQVLRPYGRFVEIGKQDIHSDARIGLLPFRRNLSYFAIDLDGMARERPERVGALLDEVLAMRARGALRDLPIRVEPVSRAADAFRELASGRTIGKLVLRTAAPDLVVADPTSAALRRGAVLITGGLGGLGLQVAASLAARGATRFALLGRSAPGDAQRVAVERLGAAGAAVTLLRADVADRDALREAIDGYEASSGPISVVVHAAGVLDDAMLDAQTPERFARAMRPKAEGAWLLHESFAARSDVHLVLFSSVVSLLGLPGQANYAAANAFLDALAHRRRAQGAPAVSINWGPWAEVGMAAGRDDRGARLAERGVRSLAVREGLAALERLLDEDHVQVAVTHFDRRAYIDAYPSAASSSMLPPDSAPADAAPGPASRPATTSLRDLLAGLPPGRRRLDAVEQRVADALSRVLRTASASIDRDKALRSLGLDSLMGLELRNRLEVETGLTLPATIVWNHPTARRLAAHLLERLDASLSGEPGAPTPDAPAPPAATRDAAAGPSDEALAALLDEIESLTPDEAGRLLASRGGARE